MLPQREVASAAPVRAAACPPPLPDLSGIGPHGLPDLDDSLLAAAVDHVLCHPSELAESWACAPRRETHGRG
ncbi:hypothetical protein V1L54_05190 [Streptomyces sp. TRM 70361]|uniref:hypothetical protein n=1 Tax=Streptomyces sp. TRM 70361 TaxID=3116553 RepID=UPI002E7B704F|nr:hypothetical protein [Streptomyces sp. TRM 70361]MEE1938812.1 hypothetical protein [Streptomyces sp. TRM 70361]